MSVKKVLRYGEKSLREPSKEVHKVSRKIQDLVQDLLDTLYSQNGVGLAAPQIGENHRVFVIDTSSGDEPLNPMVFINPKIIKKSGAFVSHEGCLSFPDMYTNVRRYKNVMIKAIDEKGRSFVLEAKDGSLLAKAIQHEYDHLDGILFIDHAINRFEAEQELTQKHLPPLEVEKLLEEPELDEELKKEAKQAK
ncbi:MAG TPA: peptide deformylase [Candidatus Gastranaerophilaceae bacterium]|nr:peptide deformylase [Candidatus Gastranaerophilaceae bacterium]